MLDTLNATSAIMSRPPGRALLCLGLLALTALPLVQNSSVAHAQTVKAGNILVIDRNAPGQSTTPNRGSLFKVNLSTGARIIISDFNDPADGPIGQNPQAVAVESGGGILVMDTNAGVSSRGILFRVDPLTGMRTVVSDFNDAAQGQLGGHTNDVVVDAAGRALVTDLAPSGAFPSGMLFRVNTSTGARTVFSDFGNAAQGPLGSDPSGVTLDEAGVIWVIDAGAGTSGNGALFRVNPSTGARTLRSDFGDPSQGPLGFNPGSIAVDRVGNFLVSDADVGTSSRGGLFSVNPSTGARTLLSDFGLAGQGPLGLTPGGLTLNANGIALVTDLNAGTGTAGILFKLINPATGVREVLTDFGNLSQGPKGLTPCDVAVYAICGDGNPDPNEECDDGNTLNGDGCSASCRVEPGFVACSKRIATMVGTPGNDTIVGTGGGDVIAGLDGDDMIFASAGRDVVCGGVGNDFIEGASNDDVLFGGPGNDSLVGNNGKDTLNGEGGNDAMTGGANNDECDGGPGTGDTANSCESVFNVP